MTSHLCASNVILFSLLADLDRFVKHHEDVYLLALAGLR